jgi:steroid delta-isomerase-like uncharacterized protein
MGLNLMPSILDTCIFPRGRESLTTAENKTVIRRFVEEVINQGRLERADVLVAKGFVELDPLPGQRQGREGLKEVIGSMRTAFPDIHWVLEEMVAEGDMVVSLFTWTGTHHGMFLGIPATGKAVNVKGVVIDHVEDGMMAESRILMDSLGLMQQLGVVPS